jgi:serine phosphatase RsbU (regulator of sigma subunit)
VRRLNALIAERNTWLSMTGVFLRVSPRGKVVASHARHPPTAVIPANGEPILVVEGGCALGTFEDEPVAYVEEVTVLAPGDLVLAYTDAVIEQRDEQGNMFGLERLAIKLASL